MTSFVKKNTINILIIAIFAILIFVPKVRGFIKNKIFMSDFMQHQEHENTIIDSEYNVKLKGVNVPDDDLKNFKGKVLFLNFWGTWCPPCVAEWPSIQKLYEDKKGTISFVLVAVKDKEHEVKDFLLQNHYTVPVYFAEDPLPEKILPKRFPTTFIIGKNGRILKKEIGSEDWNTESARNFIDTVAQ